MEDNNQGNKEEIIVVIGDWFIDENWLVAKHRTYSSSYTGDVHYLSKHKEIGKRMINLCGTSEILEVLRSYFETSSDKFKIIGFGAWNRNDDTILQCVLCPEHHEEKCKYLTPYTIRSLLDIGEIKKSRICPYSKERCTYLPNLVNLAKKIKEKGGKKEEIVKEVSTNRIIRCYEGYGSGEPHLLYRFDWQLQISDSELDYTIIRDHLNEYKENNHNITAIVIEDHGKGVISPTSIREIIKAIGEDKAKNINWYIRSKIDNPNWMDELRKNKIEARLHVIDYKLAQYRKGPRQWRYGEELSRASLEILAELTQDVWYKHTEPVQPEHGIKSHRAAVLFDDNTAIAKENNQCYNLYRPTRPKKLINIGRTTIFFIALIAQDLSQEYKDEDFGIQCDNAMECAYQWSKESSKAWNTEDPYFYGEYNHALESLGKITASQSQSKKSNYDDLWQKWIDSSIKNGILVKDKGKSIEVWRGRGILEGYICVGSPKRDKINYLVTEISKFNSQDNPQYPFNCLLVSSPGWGKSYLARCIARYFNMPYLGFSLAHMANTSDLIDCFDTICSTQNTTEEKGKVLIFMDEINCEIEGNDAISLLLGPIWEGSFVRDGKTYRLSPAVWIFASTDSVEGLIKNIKKGSDFVSRLNGPVIELDSIYKADGTTLGIMPPTLEELKKKLIPDSDIDPYSLKEYQTIADFKELEVPFRTEQVYIGVSLLNKIWGPISKVQEDVLQFFHDILPLNGYRSMEFFISKFKNIQRGVIVCSNIPSFEDVPELRRHVVLPQLWTEKFPEDKSPDENPDEFVEIVTIFERTYSHAADRKKIDSNAN
ncbi:MAG: hypothetical protein PVH61_37580 [Candidatus Aminicenantes bacterium]|jgi:hypothetical protein